MKGSESLSDTVGYGRARIYTQVCHPKPDSLPNSRSPQGLAELLIGHEESGGAMGIAGGQENLSHV